MAYVESYQDDGLLVVRKGLDSVWAQDIQDECIAAVSMPCQPSQRELGNPDDPEAWYARNGHAIHLERLGLNALAHAFQALRRPNDTLYTINQYPPHITGKPHRDLDVEPPVTLIYPDGGDLYCEEDRITMDPGDVAVLHPLLWHWGANPSSDTHYSVALWRPVPLYDRLPVPFDLSAWEEESAA